MPASDVLKSFRSKGYGDSEKKDEMNPAENTTRIIMLTDDEKKTFEQAKPGEDLACEVHGSLESDGHFHVMSVGPMGGGAAEPGEAEMAGMVAQRVQPNIAPSPS